MKMFINLFHKYLLNVYYVSNTILDSEDTAVKTNACRDFPGGPVAKDSDS